MRFKPQVILRFEVPDRIPLLYRVVQTREDQGSFHSMGLELELYGTDAMGKASWKPSNNIPRWVEVIIGMYLELKSRPA